MRVIIVANGTVERLDIIEDEDYLLCADGGANHLCDRGFKPHMIIGDFDSLTKNIHERCLQAKCEMRFNNDQNATDTQLAIREANTIDMNELILLGATGTRLDHTFANILSLLEVKKGVPAKIIDAHNEIWIAEGATRIEGDIGDLISILPLTDTVTNIRYVGLAYSPTTPDTPLGWFGVSNKMTTNEAVVSMDAGKIVVIKSRD